ncbi:MAG: transcription termination factor NusA [Candidatus Cloacimonetes bacterium]|nr:transcription termination factor NusA [Candidatus Cloacimonadota bacterium]MBL7086046.1 transcription termination factor NusA [Candidatus Cloacimonadota bacterium]
MAFNLISIIDEFARIKQIDRDKISSIIKESLESTLSKKLMKENAISVEIDFEKNEVVVKLLAKVVDEVPNNFDEITLTNAKKIVLTSQVDDLIPIEIPISEFGRKTIQSARQAIINKLRESETEKTKLDYEKQKGQIISGMVKRVESSGYIVDIGFTEALLPSEEQVDNEFYKAGDYLKAYVYNIRYQKGSVRIILSRKKPEFIIKLFENEIPEIGDGEVVIKKIVREPGYRTKVAVYSTNKNIDAFGSCVGPKGFRIEVVKKELHGELVDIVVWSDNPEQFIKNSIGNELIKRIYLAEKGKFAQVIVDEKNKNIAIGKEGRNIKLAAKLTNYKLDVLLEEEYEEITANERRITSTIYELEGVTENIGKVLYNAGYTSVQDIYLASIKELCQIDGVGVKTAEKIKESAKYF